MKGRLALPVFVKFPGLEISAALMDGSTIEVHAGVDGLIVGNRVARSTRPKPEDAVVH